jgi:hypothetical protein
VLRDLAFWFSVGLVSIVAVILFKLLAVYLPWQPLQVAAGAI